MYAHVLSQLVARGKGGGVFVPGKGDTIVKNQPSALGLQRTRLLASKLGIPLSGQHPRSVVHIVGTNGKGSVAWKVAAKVAQAKKQACGLYTSPHLFSVRERVRVDLQPISRDQFVQSAQNILNVISRDPELDAACVSYFEAMTCLALDHFRNSLCTVWVLEAGLGGAGDATNIFDFVDVACLTSVGLDHCAVLGSTVEEICREKLGIVKPGCRLVIGNGVPQKLHGLCLEIAQARQAQSVRFVLNKHESFDRENEDTANAVCEELFAGMEAHGDISENAQRPPCRFEMRTDRETKKTVILDVGHNPPALHRVIQEMKLMNFDFTKGALVFGIAADKDVRACLSELLSVAWNSIAFVRPGEVNRNMSSPSELVRIAREIQQVPINTWSDDQTSIAQNLRRCLQMPDVSYVLVCGSHSLMREARACMMLEDRDPDLDDPFDSNERGAAGKLIKL